MDDSQIELLTKKERLKISEEPRAQLLQSIRVASNLHEILY